MIRSLLQVCTIKLISLVTSKWISAISFHWWSKPCPARCSCALVPRPQPLRSSNCCRKTRRARCIAVACHCSARTARDLGLDWAPLGSSYSCCCSWAGFASSKSPRSWVLVAYCYCGSYSNWILAEEQNQSGESGCCSMNHCASCSGYDAHALRCYTSLG